MSIVVYACRFFCQLPIYWLCMTFDWPLTVFWYCLLFSPGWYVWMMWTENDFLLCRTTEWIQQKELPMTDQSMQGWKFHARLKEKYSSIHYENKQKTTTKCTQNSSIFHSMLMFWKKKKNKMNDVYSYWSYFVLWYSVHSSLLSTVYSIQVSHCVICPW